MPRKTTDLFSRPENLHHGFNEAAARCRGKPGAGPADGGGVRCFNEAAARCRGKRAPVPLDADAEQGASMRPRPDAAENSTSGALSSSSGSLQ